MLEEVVDKMVTLSNQELLNWLVNLMNYGELPEQEYIIYLECLKRGGVTASKAKYIYDRVDEIDTFICNQLADEEWKQRADEEYQKALQEDWNQYQHDRELGLA